MNKVSDSNYLKGPGGFEVMISQGSHKCLVKY